MIILDYRIVGKYDSLLLNFKSKSVYDPGKCQVKYFDDKGYYKPGNSTTINNMSFDSFEGQLQMFRNKGDKVLIVDDVLSTGGTLRAVTQALRSIGADIVDTVIVFNKHRGKKKLEDELGIEIKTLLDVDVVDGKVVVV